MPVDVIWDNDEQTIIRQIYKGEAILDDYYIAIDKFCDLASSVNHTVHSIMDRREMLVSRGSYLQVLRYANGKMPDNVGLRVIIKSNSMMNMMINVGRRIAPNLIDNIRLVDTLEDAYATIKNELATTS